MYCLNVFIAIAIVAIAQINAVPIVEDIYGNSYYLIPLDGVDQPSRDHLRHTRSANPHHTEDHTNGNHRKTTYDIGNRHVGLGQKYAFVDNDNHKFSANAYASRDFHPKGPLTTGQGAEYLHKPSQSNFKVNAQNTRGQGTDYKASGTYNFFQSQDKRGHVGIGGEYERHHGGPGGTTKPDYSVVLKGTYDLP